MVASAPILRAEISARRFGSSVMARSVPPVCGESARFAETLLYKLLNKLLYDFLSGITVPSTARLIEGPDHGVGPGPIGPPFQRSIIRRAIETVGEMSQRPVRTMSASSPRLTHIASAISW